MTSADDDAESLTVEVPGSSNGTLRKERDNAVEDGVDVIDNPSGVTLNAVGSNLPAFETVDINEPYLGGEPMHFGEDVERESLVQILKTLTQEEKVSMNDITMPIRHLRAEKVSEQNTLLLALVQKEIHSLIQFDTFVRVLLVGQCPQGGGQDS